MNAKPDITAVTKVGALLDAYPELEATLMDQSPAFAKLKNPVLRKTVAKVATLKTAADIAGLPVGSLVAALRKAAGFADTGEGCADTEAASLVEDAPAWTATVSIAADFAAEDYLARGEHPLGDIQSAVRRLAPGQAVRLRSGFVPAPLIEHFRGQGLRTCTTPEGEGYITIITP